MWTQTNVMACVRSRAPLAILVERIALIISWRSAHCLAVPLGRVDQRGPGLQLHLRKMAPEPENRPRKGFVMECVDPAQGWSEAEKSAAKHVSNALG